VALAASENGHLDVVRLLLQNGATVDSCNIDGAAVGLLLQHRAAVESRGTLLMLASQCGHLDIVRLLLQNGASMDSCDNYGSTPLAYGKQGNFFDETRTVQRTANYPF
jgi:serine/threonine-protein phosphatase 6 regulatory ankyrin repeat subunit B